MNCPKCQDRGTVNEKCRYPWGGYDWVPAFCDCEAGRREEKSMYEVYFGDFPPSNATDKNIDAV